MTECSTSRSIHPHLHVAHATRGRIRLRASKVRGQSEHAEEVARRLSAVPGVHSAHADPATGSITVHYHHSALESAKFMAEIAGALGLVAAGLEPEAVEAMFGMLGVSPKELCEEASLPVLALSVGLIGLGFFAYQRFGR